MLAYFVCISYRFIYESTMHLGTSWNAIFVWQLLLPPGTHKNNGPSAAGSGVGKVRAVLGSAVPGQEVPSETLCSVT